MATYEFVPIGEDAKYPQPGDLIFAHRRGFASWAIRTGQWVRYRGGDHWSHVAVCMGDGTIVEALTKGVERNPISNYRHIEYALLRTELTGDDAKQAMKFVESCIGCHYGFGDDLGIALRFLTPGRGLWFGMNGTEICSGLAAQALCRGWYIFEVNPASISPAELAIHLGVPRPR